MSKYDAKALFESLPNDSTIYCTMYGQSFENEESTVDILKSETKYTVGDDRFIYIWGYPGPDYNVYRFADYGKTWALSMNDFK